MIKSRDSKKLQKDVEEIDLQIEALAKLKQRHLARLSAAESPENQMTREERRKVLAAALAEGIVFLGQNGLLPLTESVKSDVLLHTGQPINTKSPNEERPKGRK